MSVRLEITEAATVDVCEQLDWLTHQDSGLPVQFRDGLRATYDQLMADPDAGSIWFPSGRLRRYVSELRYRRVVGFPQHFVFYVSQPEVVQILCALHGARDLDAILGG